MPNILCPLFHQQHLCTLEGRIRVPQNLTYLAILRDRGADIDEVVGGEARRRDIVGFDRAAHALRVIAEVESRARLALHAEYARRACRSGRTLVRCPSNLH